MTLVAGCYERFIFGFDPANNASKVKQTACQAVLGQAVTAPASAA